MDEKKTGQNYQRQVTMNGEARSAEIAATNEFVPI